MSRRRNPGSAVRHGTRTRILLSIIRQCALIEDGKMYVQVGPGIVADSDLGFEQQECVNKAKALFRAAEEARRFATAAKRGQSVGFGRSSHPLRVAPDPAATN